MLEGCEGLFSDLITTKTSGINRKATIRNIKTNLASWMMNRNFDRFRHEPLDLAIVAKVDKRRMERQDVDNIAKVVLDALRKNKEIDWKEDVFLFHDDSQVARLLVWKMPREEDGRYDTDGVVISFRIHDPQKQMLLVSVDEI